MAVAPVSASAYHRRWRAGRADSGQIGDWFLRAVLPWRAVEPKPLLRLPVALLSALVQMRTPVRVVPKDRCVCLALRGDVHL